MIDAFKELKIKINTVIKLAKKEKKQIAFFIGNTKKNDKALFYITPIRLTENYVYFGVIVYDDLTAKEIAKKVDGKVNLIFVDTEKKTFKGTKFNKKNIVNTEKTIKENIKKSYLRFYKGNDLTVNAAENLIEARYKKEIRNISGKKILIFGTGNIGFKLGLRLIERGAAVYLFRRNKEKLKKICELINFIKPKGTDIKAKAIFKLNNDFKKYDVIVFTADSTETIKLKSKKIFKKGVLLIDVGKGMFDQKSLAVLNENKQLVHRLDVTPNLNTLIEETHTIKKFSNKKFKILKKGKFVFVSPGLLGSKDSLIVDDPINPKKIYGLCDGQGDFIRLNNLEKQKIIIEVGNITKNKIKFD